MIFCVTFGQVHPLRDNWIEVEAENERIARELVFARLGDKWAFMYSRDRFTPQDFPSGKAGWTIRGG